MSSLLHLLASRGEENLFPSVAFFLVAMVLVAAFLASERKEAQRRITRFAADLNGWVVPGRRTGRGVDDPSIRFQVCGLSALMSFSPDRPSKTALEVRIPSHAEGSLTLEAVGAGRMITGFYGPDRPGVGEKAFDARFMLRSAPEGFASRIFSGGRRLRFIQTMRRLTPMTGVGLSLEPGRLEITVAEELKEWPQVLQLKLAAEELVGLLQSLPPPGIELGERAERAGGLCPICTTPLRDPLVRCTRCSSPHHQDCWEYLGRCATYGCDPKGRRTAA